MCSGVIEGPVYLVSGARKWGRRWLSAQLGICGACYRLATPGAPAATREKPKVRWYDMTGRGEQQSAAACEACGRMVIRNADPLLKRVTCSHSCATSFTRSRNGNQGSGQPCEVCGTAITTGRADSRTCSPACRQKAYRQRKAGERAAAIEVAAKPPTRKGRGRSQQQSIQSGVSWLSGLTAALDGVKAIDPDITAQEAAQWSAELDDSLRVLEGFATKLEDRQQHPHA